MPILVVVPGGGGGGGFHEYFVARGQSWTEQYKGLLETTWLLCAAVGDAERGTLHIILNSGDDSAFRVSDSAMEFR